MIRLAPIALLLLAILVPLCTGTIWGSLLLLVIACGIFIGTVQLGGRDTSKDYKLLGNNKS
jgi:hypothetical protein